MSIRIEQININNSLCLIMGDEFKQHLKVKSVKEILDSNENPFIISQFITAICDLCHLTGLDDYFNIRVLINTKDGIDISPEIDTMHIYEKFVQIITQISKNFIHDTRLIENNIISILNDTLNDIMLYGTIESDISLAYFCKRMIKEVFIDGRRILRSTGWRLMTDELHDTRDECIRTYYYNWIGKLYALSHLVHLMDNIRAATHRIDRLHDGFSHSNLICALAAVNQQLKHKTVMDIIKTKIA